MAVSFAHACTRSYWRVLDTTDIMIHIVRTPTSYLIHEMKEGYQAEKGLATPSGSSADYHARAYRVVEGYAVEWRLWEPRNDEDK